MADPVKEITVIAKDARINGEMSFQNTVRVLGVFEGKIKGSGELQVAAGSTCKANLDVATLVVDGNIEGNVFAKDRMTLNATGVIRGDVVAGKMVMLEGATMFGQCAVGADVVKAGPPAEGQFPPPPVRKPVETR